MAEIPFGVNSLKISNINILNKTSDPRIVGDSSPVNSVYYRDNGEIYFKFNTGNTDWELIHPKETKDITANYTILRTNSNLIVNTTSSNITLTLPDVSTLYKSKEYYFKKTSGNNSLIINPHSGQTIDGESSKTFRSQISDPEPIFPKSWGPIPQFSTKPPLCHSDTFLKAFEALPLPPHGQQFWGRANLF